MLEFLLAAFFLFFVLPILVIFFVAAPRAFLGVAFFVVLIAMVSCS